MKYLTFIFALSLFTSPTFSQEIWEVFDTITFEKPCDYLEIDSSSNNIWQIGVVKKDIFNNAYSPINAIVTDTIYHYPVSNYSYFDIKIGSFNLESYNQNLFIGIKHKFDTDRLRDGGYITVSHDRGQTWSNIVFDTLQNNNFNHCWPIKPGFGSEGNDFNNLYTKMDTLFNGEYGFSGSSDDWVNTWFSWHCLLVKKENSHFRSFGEDTMILRFNFISDTIDSEKDGWIIDDIMLFAGDLDSSINNQYLQNFKIFPNPTTDIISLDFDEYQNDIDLIIFDINGNIILKKHHQKGHSIEIESKGLFSGIYLIKVYSNDKIKSIGRFIVK